MKCPRCDSRTRVWDSRQQTDNTVFRRRRCVKCGYGFITYEISAAKKASVEQAIKTQTEGSNK